jgi:hypothetical protein
MDHPTAAQSGLSRDEVAGYLLALKANGFAVHRTEPGAPREAYAVLLEDGTSVSVRDAGGGAYWHIVGDRLGLITNFGFAKSVGQFRRLMAQAARSYGVDWSSPLTTTRLPATTPATNRRTISGLIGSAEVQAVFDPYLDNRGLVALGDILTFGGSVSGAVRLLTSTRKANTKNPQLTKSLAEAWFKERGIAGGEVRVMAPDEHRRFLLMSGGKSLILGLSLDSLEKNEAAHLEDDGADRTFFDRVWASAAPLT